MQRGAHAVARRPQRLSPTRCSTSTAARAAATAATRIPDESSERSAHRATAGRSPQDGVLVGTGGHLHPGGLWTDLVARARRQTGALFRSRAQVLRARRRGVVGRGDGGHAGRSGASASRRGDVLSISATYDSKRASWYEAMGIMRSPSTRAAAGRTRSRPTSTSAACSPTATWTRTATTAARSAGCADPRKLLGAGAATPHGRRSTTSSMARGDLLRTGKRGRPPAVRRGPLAEVRQPRRAARGSCTRSPRASAPCNRTTGIAYPLANGPVRFDSGNLGFGPGGGPPRRTARRGRRRRSLRAGDLHVLLPRAPVHARRVPRQALGTARR